LVYALGSSDTFGWGNFTRQALHTACRVWAAAGAATPSAARSISVARQLIEKVRGRGKVTRTTTRVTVRGNLHLLLRTVLE